MAKKPRKKKFNRNKFFTLVGIAVVVALILVFAICYAFPKVRDQERLERIQTIFSSLKLGDTYRLQSSNVFGDKRIYSWDKDRSYASTEVFARGADVNTTVSEIKKAVAKTDFTFYEEPYPGSAYWEYIYKNAKNEYLRITISSKLRDDALFNDSIMTNKLSTATYAISPNDGPSNVTIKVNIDNNNE